VDIEIVERDAANVAYLRYTGPFGERLGRFWRATVAPWLAEQGLLDCPRYGVSLDDPGRTPPEQCRYDACVELPPGLHIADAAETIIPGGRYAVMHFRGTTADIGAAWESFTGRALSDPANRLDRRRQPFEHYPRGAGFELRTGVFRCTLCLPLEN
jgi:AraC family transcriptional regulator